MSSKFHPNFSGLNVRNDGPQPCIFVRSFSPITSKLGEYSDKTNPMIGNLAEYSDKAENDMADAASRAEASMQLMEIEIASYSMRNVVLSEVHLALEICPNLGSNVFWLNIRTRGSQASICVRIFTQFTNTPHFGSDFGSYAVKITVKLVFLNSSNYVKAGEHSI